MNSQDLKLILNSDVAITVIETYDENRAIDLLRDLFKNQRLPSYKWSVTEGLLYLLLDLESSMKEKKQDPEELLKHIKFHRPASAFILCDFH